MQNPKIVITQEEQTRVKSAVNYRELNKALSENAEVRHGTSVFAESIVYRVLNDLKLSVSLAAVTQTHTDRQH